ncbi:MAG: ribosomal protein [Patescibacteria group bacterium]|jgi:large subunit ribosomal protein L2|nr:ribosomal protein [Patescibacteria group bacterium]MDQ5970238.1 ribosomal protein [Patescibacteria group bacterium]
MPIKLYKPTTSARRHTSVLVRHDLSKKRPERALVYHKKRAAGRNAQGKITVRHQGGGARKLVRIIDFLQDKYDIPGVVRALEYDPNRNATIALIVYKDGEKRYIIAPDQIKVGDAVVSSLKTVPMSVGNRMPLGQMPTGTLVHNVEIHPGKGGKLARSAGNSLLLTSLDGEKAILKMPSGEIRIVLSRCSASVGVPSNAEFRNIRWGKAGRMRHRGIRPTVRGKAMNPVDHPHGGGEGHNPIGLKAPKTYTGKKALGVKTRKANKYSNKFIIQRRSKNK